LNGDELELLRNKALDFKIILSERQLKLFRIYLDELWNWNRRMNLTGLSTRRRIILELLLDSLIPAPFLPEKGIMLDAGSGAGLPGLPLKIYNPRLKTHLLETKSKKVSFLNHVIRLLRLNEIEVIKGRIEKDVKKHHPAGYHIITARALARLSQTVAWCAPLLCPGGLLVSFLGSRADEDLKESRQIVEEQGLVLEKRIPYVLPGKRSKRNTIIFKKKAN